MKDGERELPIENYGKKEQKEWLDNILPDPHPCTAGNKEEEHSISKRALSLIKRALSLIKRAQLSIAEECTLETQRGTFNGSEIHNLK